MSVLQKTNRTPHTNAQERNAKTKENKSRPPPPRLSIHNFPGLQSNSPIPNFTHETNQPTRSPHMHYNQNSAQPINHIPNQNNNSFVHSLVNSITTYIINIINTIIPSIISNIQNSFSAYFNNINNGSTAP